MQTIFFKLVILLGDFEMMNANSVMLIQFT